MTQDQLPSPGTPRAGAILALCVFGTRASAAVRRTDGHLVECVEEVGQSHSGRMLPLVGAALHEAGCGFASLAGVAFEAGPGGFTSLRIACALAQGFGAALGIPVCPVGTLEAAAVAVARRQGRSGTAIIVNDARMGECYAGVFDVDLAIGEVRARVGVRAAARCVARDAIAAQVAQWVSAARVSAASGGVWIAGDALGLLDQAADAPGVERAEGIGADAASIAWAAADSAAPWLDPGDAAPRYVRDKVALDVDEQRALRAARR